MKRIFYLLGFIVVVAIFLTMNQTNTALCSNKKYTISKNELFAELKNVTLQKVDVNSDNLIDLVVVLPWGGSELYINCGNEQYYRVIRSAGQIKIQSNPKGDWSHIFIDTSSNGNGDYYWDKDLSTLVDGRVYRADCLELGNIFEVNPNNPDEEIVQTGEALIKFDGVSYKPTYNYSKHLEIYAPHYRFEYLNSSNGGKITKMVTSIYIELPEGKYKIFSDKQPESIAYNRLSSIDFVELNGDNLMDNVVYYYYDDGGSAGRENFAALMLNSGDNSYIYSGKVYLGRERPKLQSRKINIGGKYFTALVNKCSGEKNKYDLYIYQEKLKEFLHTIAIQGSDKSTFVPIDKKQFENIINPPLLRNLPVNPGNSTKTVKVDESAISKLIDNYEKSLVNAINSGKFSLVEKYLTPGSNLYKSQKNLVAKLYKKGTKEKLVDFKVNNIKTTAKPNVYQVYVYEKIGIKRADKADFTVSEFKWVYTVVFDGTKYSLSEIAKWDEK